VVRGPLTLDPPIFAITVNLATALWRMVSLSGRQSLNAASRGPAQLGATDVEAGRPALDPAQHQVRDGIEADNAARYGVTQCRRHIVDPNRQTVASADFY
jgi:hypothetical protein